MSEIGANDARTHLIELLERAEHGEESTISTGGDPTARISPVTPAHDPEEARAAFARIRAFARAHPIPNLTIEEIKSWIEEGRP
jgi:prevent-host-death family protein